MTGPSEQVERFTKQLVELSECNPFRAELQLLRRIDHCPAARQWKEAWPLIPESVKQRLGGGQPKMPAEVLIANQQMLLKLDVGFAAFTSEWGNKLLQRKHKGRFANELYSLFVNMRAKSKEPAKISAELYDTDERPLVYTFLYVEILMCSYQTITEALELIGAERVAADQNLAWIARVRDACVSAASQQASFALSALDDDAIKDITPEAAFANACAALAALIKRASPDSWEDIQPAIAETLESISKLAELCGDTVALAKASIEIKAGLTKLVEALASFQAQFEGVLTGQAQPAIHDAVYGTLSQCERTLKVIGVVDRLLGELTQAAAYAEARKKAVGSASYAEMGALLDQMGSAHKALAINAKVFTFAWQGLVDGLRLIQPDLDSSETDTAGEAIDEDRIECPEPAPESDAHVEPATTQAEVPETPEPAPAEVAEVAEAPEVEAPVIADTQDASGDAKAIDRMPAASLASAPPTMPAPTPEEPAAAEVQAPYELLAHTFTDGAPGLGLALARALDLDRGEPLPGAPPLYALLAAASAQNRVLASNHAYLDAPLAEVMNQLSGPSVGRADRPIAFAAIAASLRPALFDLQHGNAVPFLREMSRKLGLGHAVRALAGVATKPMTIGLHDLRPEVLARGYQASDVHQKERIAAFAQRARNILARKDSACLCNFSSFPVAQKMYDDLLGEGHPIGRALFALQGGAPDAVRRAVAVARNELKQDRFVYIQDSFRASGQPFKLIGAYYERIKRLLDELETFFTTIEAEVGAEPESADLARAADFAVELDEHLEAVQVELAPITGEIDDAAGVSARVLLSVVNALRALISSGAKPTTTCALDEYLNRPLSALDIALGPDLSGQAASGYALGIEAGFKSDARVVVEAIEAVNGELADQPQTYLSACERHLDNDRVPSARRALIAAEGLGAPPAELKPLQARLNKALEASRAQLLGEIDRLNVRLYSLYALGLIPDAERSKLEAELELLRTRVHDLPQIEPVISIEDLAAPHDLSEARARLQAGVAAQLDAVLKKGCEALRGEIEVLGPRLADVLREQVPRVLEVLDVGSLDIARDYWSMLQSGQHLPHASGVAESLEEFHRSFLPAVENGRLSSILGDSIRTLNAEVGESQGQPGNEEAQSAVAMLTAWQGLFSTGPATQRGARALQDFFANFLDLQVLSVQALGGTAYPTYRVEGLDLATALAPGQFLLPALGSEKAGTFAVAMLPHSAPRHALNEAATRTDLDLIMTRRALSADDRSVLYQQFRRASRGPGVIDDALIVYAAQGRRRADRIVGVMSSFCVSHPYGDNQNMPREMFFGRAAARQSIVDARAGVLVYGGRRLGKSSLLRDIARRNTNPSTQRYFIYVDMVAATAEEYRKVLYARVTQAMVEAKLLPRTVNRSSSPARLLKEIGDAIKASKMQVMVLVDEADDILRHEAAATPRFPLLTELNKLLKDTEGRFRFAIAGLHNTERLARYANSVLDQMSDPVALTPFVDAERAAGIDLVVKPMAALGFRFESTDIAYEIVSTAMFFPALTQVYCQSLLSVMYTSPLHGLPPYTITRDHLRRVNLDESLSRKLLTIFSHTLALDPRYRVIALAMAYQHLQNTQVGSFSMEPAALAEMVKHFAPKLFPADTEINLVDALCDELVNLGVLIRVSGGREIQLRSISLLSRLGTRQEIDQALIEADRIRLDHDAGEQRVVFSGGQMCPLSVRTIADLGHPAANKPPVRLVVASPAIGAADLERLGTDSGWLHGRATASLIRALRQDGRDIVDAAIKPPLKPGRLTIDGTACNSSRSLLVVAPGWPVGALSAIRQACPQIVDGDRTVALLVDPEQAARLVEHPRPAFPILSAGLWGVDAAFFFARSIERSPTPSEDELERLVAICGRVPALVRAALTAGGSLPDSTAQAAALAGVALNRQELLRYFGVPPSARDLVGALALSNVTMAQFSDAARKYAPRCDPDTLFDVLVALGALVAAGAGVYGLNPLIDEAISQEG